MKEVTTECVSTSLFDYLGYAAGSKLGWAVAGAAALAGEPKLIRKVKTKTYTGPINVYRRSFLDLYFNKTTQVAPTDVVINTNELPF